MKKISYKQIIKEVSNLIIDINYGVSKNIEEYLKKAYYQERNGLSKKYLKIVLENIKISKKEKLPLCQDTGYPVVFVEIGSNVKIEKGPFPSLIDIINFGIEDGSKKGYLRNSVVEPIDRNFTGYNTPCVIHFFEGKENKLKITIMAKGFGSENTCKMKMLNVADGKEGIENFIVDTIKQAGSLPCPPIFVGVGIGGTFEMSPLLAKISLLKIGEKSKYRNWELEIMKKINKLKIGAGGFGGKTTALDLKIETHPTHIAGLPVSVCISCWAHRVEKLEL
ncbi:MAG TPA: fumarate hydratase [bacterium]|nr:fumarate hydratase [bacterium]